MTNIVLISIPNKSLKQYFYNVVKEFNDIGLDDVTTTECFYEQVEYCYVRLMTTDECVNEIINWEDV